MKLCFDSQGGTSEESASAKMNEALSDDYEKTLEKKSLRIASQ
jgi:hypothetical protein